jgi:glycosyltransferase involved in cell wall biosynthesis
LEVRVRVFDPVVEKSPEVSVIMPVYNAEEFLAEALQSVLGQTHHSFELIAVDDGSTDRSTEILADFARRDNRLVSWRTENRGVAAALNACLERARNDLVIRFDADDLMLPNRLERQVWFMQQHPDISVAASYAWLIDRNGNLVAEANPTIDVDRGIRDYNPHWFVDFIHPSCIMRKRHIQLAGGYSSEYYPEDRELWGRLVASGYRLAVQPEFLVKHRLYKSSVTARTGLRRHALLCEFVDQNIIRLLQGQTYVSFQAFLDNRRRTPVLKRFVRNANEVGKACYKAATREFAEREWWRCLMHSTAAICINPIWGVRMLRKVAHRKRSQVSSGSGSRCT